MSKYYKATDIEALITACEWRMTLAKERGGEGFVDYSKQILDVDELTKRLSALPTIEVSEDCISREGVYRAIITCGEVDNDLNHLYEVIENAPSVIPTQNNVIQHVESVESVEKPKEGEWINKQEKYRMAECSNCKKVTMHEMWGDKLVYYDYCPNCGAKMKGADDEEVDVL